jgi:hypothetical protein
MSSENTRAGQEKSGRRRSTHLGAEHDLTRTLHGLSPVIAHNLSLLAPHIREQI